VATALNLGVKRAKGEYISWLSHDDLYYPEKIEKQINFLGKNKPKNVIIFSNYSTINSSGKVIVNKKISQRAVKNIRCLLAIDLENTLNGCTLLISKKIFSEKNLFDSTLKYTQDYDMWFRLFKKNIKFSYLDDFLIFSRQHKNQGGQSNIIAATLESDQLHSDMINDLSNSEVNCYCDTSPDFLINIYKIYRNSGYTKTSFRLLKHICRLLLLNGAQKQLSEILDNEIFNFNDFEKTQNVLNDTNIFSKKSKPRLLFYSNVWAMGGIERALSGVMGYLSNFYEVILVSTSENIGNHFVFSSNIKYIKISENHQNMIVQRLASLCVLLDIDLFIGSPNHLLEFLGIYEILNKLKIKSIAWNHGNYFLPCAYPPLYPVFEKRIQAYRYADVSIWINKFSSNLYSLINQNGVYMPNSNTYREKLLPQKKNGKIILCVGRFYDRIKRLDKTLIVFKEVLNTHSDAKLILVGGYDLDMRICNGPRTTIRSLLKSLKIPLENISFEGEQRDVERYYKKASLLLLTSDSEGFAIVLNEAGVFGLPSVIFEIPGLEDIVSDGENGFIISKEDYSQMAEKINLLLSDNKLRLKMGDAAQKLARRFDKKFIDQKWLDLVKSVICSDSRSNIDKKLKSKFTESLGDQNKFSLNLVRAYENNINLVMKNCYEKSEKIGNITSLKEKISNIPLIGPIIVGFHIKTKRVFQRFL
jgi:glycosyltransferase involved in cell wall biosynthesis